MGEIPMIVVTLATVCGRSEPLCAVAMNAEAYRQAPAIGSMLEPEFATHIGQVPPRSPRRRVLQERREEPK